MWISFLIGLAFSAPCNHLAPTQIYGEDFPAYMMLMQGFHPEMKDCFHFFNESTICFSEESAPKDWTVHDVLVQELEANRIVTPATCDPLADNRYWHLHDVSHRTAGGDRHVDFCYQDPQPRTTVYIVDSYLDISHPEFEGRARVGIKVVGGQSNMHGTHVAGLVGGRRVGVNRQAQLVSVQVLNDDGFGSWQEIIAGLEWITKQKDKGIINMSISGARSNIINKVVNRMVQKGYKIVVAAGNDGQDACGFSPASASEAITVGAYASNNRWAAFSNHGRCVDILAPGDTIASAIPNRQYGYMSGTSMAAPLVAGTWSSFPKWNKETLLEKGVERPISGLPARTIKNVVYNGGEGKKRFLSSNSDEFTNQCTFRN